MIADHQYDSLHRLDLLRHYRDEDSSATYEANIDAMLAGFDYDLLGDGRRSGVTETDDQGRTTRIDWDYDAVGRLTREAFNSYNDSLDFVTDYLFDLVGNRLAKLTDSDPDWAQIAGGTEPSFDETVFYLYDANDRLLNETKDAPGTVDDRHTVYEFGNNATSTYGGDGTAETKKTVFQGLDDSGVTLESSSSTYNLQDRLSRVEIDSNGDGVTDSVVEFDYDSAGLRIAKTVDGVTDRYLFDSQNMTGYAQVLEEISDTGEIIRSYLFGLQIASQFAASQPSANSSLFFLLDGHGSTRVLIDGNGTIAVVNDIAQVFQYDAYGNAIDFSESSAATNNLYSGEWWQIDVRQQWLRARFYDPASGRFNRRDPFFGNLGDPLSLHKYLYVHADPIHNVDPSGLMTLRQAIVSIGIVSAFLTTTTWLAPAFHGRFTASWGIVNSGKPQKIAIVDGGLGTLGRWSLQFNAISLIRFKNELIAAGHQVAYRDGADEQEVIALLNNNDIVVILGHGPPDAFDEHGRPIAAVYLNGTTVHDAENDVRRSIGGTPSANTEPLSPAWITANELQGKVRNPQLVFVVPGCNGGRTDRLYRASNAKLFVGNSRPTNSANVKETLQWVVDYLNDGEKAANDNFLQADKHNVVNPQNQQFP